MGDDSRENHEGRIESAAGSLPRRPEFRAGQGKCRGDGCLGPASPTCSTAGRSIGDGADWGRVAARRVGLGWRRVGWFQPVASLSTIKSSSR